MHEPSLLELGSQSNGSWLRVLLPELQHLLITGDFTSRQLLLKAVVYKLLKRSLPGECKVLLYDSDSTGLAVFNHYPYLLAPADKRVSEQPPLLLWLREELEARSRGKEQEWMALEKPRYIVVLSDLKPFFEESTDTRPPDTMMGLLEYISQKGAPYGIHLIAGLSLDSKGFRLLPHLRPLFPAQLTFRLANLADSLAVLGRAGAEELSSSDEFYLLRKDRFLMKRGRLDLVTDKQITRKYLP